MGWRNVVNVFISGNGRLLFDVVFRVIRRACFDVRRIMQIVFSKNYIFVQEFSSKHVCDENQHFTSPETLAFFTYNHVAS